MYIDKAGVIIIHCVPCIDRFSIYEIAETAV